VFVILSDVLWTAEQHSYMQAFRNISFCLAIQWRQNGSGKTKFRPQIYFYLLHIFAIGLLQFDVEYSGKDKPR
jgi:hypothetical protein